MALLIFCFNMCLKTNKKEKNSIIIKSIKFQLGKHIKLNSNRELLDLFQEIESENIKLNRKFKIKNCKKFKKFKKLKRINSKNDFKYEIYMEEI